LKSTLQQAAGNVLPGGSASQPPLRNSGFIFYSLANPAASYGECARYFGSSLNPFKSSEKGPFPDEKWASPRIAEGIRKPPRRWFLKPSLAGRFRISNFQQGMSNGEGAPLYLGYTTAPYPTANSTRGDIDCFPSIFDIGYWILDIQHTV
jgi:hypothetical protein